MIEKLKKDLPAIAGKALQAGELKVLEDLKETPKQRWLNRRLLLAASFILAIGLILAIASLAKNKTSSTPTSNLTVTWKTYEDPTGSYSISYPSDWSKDTSESMNVNMNPRGKRNDLTLKGPQGEVVIEWLDQYGGVCPPPGKIEQFTFGNLTMDEVCYEIDSYNGNVETWNGSKDLGIQNHIGIWIIARATPPIGQNRNTILKMLSTFRFDDLTASKFTDQNSTDSSRWKTFKKQEYNFMFDYPSNWKITEGGQYGAFGVNITSPTNFQVSFGTNEQGFGGGCNSNLFGYNSSFKYTFMNKDVNVFSYGESPDGITKMYLTDKDVPCDNIAYIILPELKGIKLNGSETSGATSIKMQYLDHRSLGPETFYNLDDVITGFNILKSFKTVRQ